eukprot:1143948-Pyramimonas_sp.AAC.1
MGPPAPALGPSLGLSWGSLRPSEARPGQFSGSVGQSWGSVGGLFGGLGAVLGAPSAVVERREVENARHRKTLQKPMEIKDLSLFGLSRDASRSSLEASWRPLGL